MALSAGSRLGPYEITALIGKGSMGEVYRATDTKLKRQVAIKVLPDSLADDPEWLARFQREAEVLASLNHPNIAVIYGREDASGAKALVMELVEGPTLADRIAQGAIPIDEALPLAKQIADALEAAHDQGIVHRDLKPGNIKVRDDGTVKVLDFGLAKATERASGGDSVTGTNASILPTVAPQAPTTGMGMILGTPSYMSPEQARGKTVDRRADIWAFGAVLFEMLTGTRPFDDDDVSMILSRVLQREPDLALLPPDVPARVRQTIRLCLRKDPKQRVGDIRDVRLAFEGAFETESSHLVLSKRHDPWPWIAVAGLVVLIAVLSIPALQHVREAPPAETRTEIVTPPTDDAAAFALSPDGRQVVFAATGEGGPRLWLRSLAGATAQPLPGTERGSYPFWSPDGRSIGFFTAAALKRLDLSGGTPQTLASVLSLHGGAWSSDGVILFTPTVSSGLMRIAATGGEPTVVTKLDPGQTSHRWPNFLPDDRRFLFYARGGPNVAGIYLGSLDGNGVRRLTPADSAGAYLPSGWLVWTRAGTLVAQRLDVDRAILIGEPVTVATGVAADSSINASAVAVSASGLMAYRAGGNRRQLTWFDRLGTAHGVFGAPDDANLSEGRLSPDGSRVVAVRELLNNSDLWLLDGARVSRLTFGQGTDGWPVWSPDGGQVAFFTTRTGRGDLYLKVLGEERDELLVTSDELKVATGWSPDGRYLLYSARDAQAGDFDLWVLPMTGSRTPSIILKTSFNEFEGVFSPDGRWIAYTSDESGTFEAYVRPFVPSTGAGAGASGPWQVSAGGGLHPVWSQDGKELFYVHEEGGRIMMMATPIAIVGSRLDPGAPVALFAPRIYGGVRAGLARQYDVASDGRFLVNTVVGEPSAAIMLVQHWQPPSR